MLKRHVLIACFACVLGFTKWSHAQAVPTASHVGTIQVGVGATFVKPDYTTETAKGIAVYGDFDFTRHIGLEADVHIASLITPNDVGENTYLIGPRYVYRFRRLAPYGKVLFGIGDFQFQQGSYGSGSNSTYVVEAFGAGLDIQATRRISIRAIDFEFQKWPNFPPNGLTPTAITVGVAYVFH